MLILRPKCLSKGIWAVTETDEDEEIRRREAFLKSVVPSTRAQFTVLSQSYQVCGGES